MSSNLTPLQKQKIEENRRKALELRAAKAKQQQQQPPSVPNTSFKPRTFYQAPKTTPGTASTSSSYSSVPNRSSQPFTKKTYASQKQGLSSNFSNGTNSLNPAKRVVTGSLTLMSRSRFELIMEYHQATIDAIKAIPGREYDAKKKNWNFPLNQYDKVVAVLNKLRPSVVVGELPKLVVDTFVKCKNNSDASNVDLSRIQTSMRSTLLDFQVEGVKFAVSKGGRVLIADDMGLGKTIQALAISDYYRSDWPLLIVCPSSMRFQWVEEIQKHLKNVDSASIFVITNGRDQFGKDAQVVITSYDLMTSFKDRLLAMNFGVVIMDESHHLKNPKTLRTKSGTELVKKCRRCVLLSGTPVLSRPVELHCQLQCVKPQVFNKFMEFAVRYCDAKQERFGWDYSGSSNMTELGILLKELLMIRRLKSEVLAQLPPKRREVVVLESKGKKLSETSELAKILASEGLKGMEKRSTLLSYFHETGVAKTKGVCQYVQDMIENGEKFLVFAHHGKVLEAICKAVEEKKADYIRIDGSVNSEVRKELCNYFQEQERCLVAVLSIKAANTGLTLTAARLVIFAELYWNPGDLIQAEDRAHRIGQADSVLVQYLVQNGTADDEIWPLVQDKLNLLHKAGLSADDFREAETLNIKSSQSQEKKDISDYFLTNDDQALAELDLCQLVSDEDVPPKKPRLE